MEIVNQLIKKPSNKTFHHIRSESINENIQMDLLDLNSLSKYNSGFKYIAVVIDVYSRYLWAYSMKKKSDFIELFPKIIKNLSDVPKTITCDNDSMFTTKKVKEKYPEIKWYFISPGSVDKGKVGLVERVNRTIREKLFKQMLYSDSIQAKTRNRKRFDWVSILPKVIEQYNNTKHTTTKEKPFDVYYNNKTWIDKREDKPTKIKEQDIVRIKLESSNVFEKKSFIERWSRDIYIVIGKENYRFKLMDINGEILKEPYRADQLQVIPQSSIEKNEKFSEKTNDKRLDEVKEKDIEERKQQRFLRKEFQ